MEDVEYARLKKYAGFSVDKVKSGGGAPSGDPVERAFESGGPPGGEDGEDVLISGEGLDSVELGEVGHGFIDDLGELVVVVIGGGWTGEFGEVVDLVVELLVPCFVESVEVHKCKLKDLLQLERNGGLLDKRLWFIYVSCFRVGRHSAVYICRRGEDILW